MMIDKSMDKKNSCFNVQSNKKQTTIIITTCIANNKHVDIMNILRCFRSQSINFCLQPVYHHLFVIELNKNQNFRLFHSFIMYSHDMVHMMIMMMMMMKICILNPFPFVVDNNSFDQLDPVCLQIHLDQ